MYEVEVKARLKDRNAVLKKLESLGCKFGEVLHQIDDIFTPDSGVFPPPRDVCVLRIRNQNSKYIFNLKINQSSRQDCIEHELEIGDRDEMEKIILLLGYKRDVTVDKNRIKTKYQDMEIVLDTVKGLGEFIEAEKMVNEADPEARKKIQEELLNFLYTLVITKDDVVIDGKYDIMLFEQMNKR